MFTWRRQARTVEKVVSCFAPVQIAAAVETGEENSKPRSEDDRRMRQLPAARNGLIEIDLELAGGASGWMHKFDPEALARVLDVLGLAMIAVPGNARVWLATGHTDMRREIPEPCASGPGEPEAGSARW